MVIKACSYRNFWAEIPLAILWQNWQFSVTNFSRYSIKNFRYYMENECHEISKFCIKYSTILCTNSEFLCFIFFLSIFLFYRTLPPLFFFFSLSFSFTALCLPFSFSSVLKYLNKFWGFLLHFCSFSLF